MGSTIAGGASSHASMAHATVGGGSGNSATGEYATIAGGNNGQATASHSTVGGGTSNQAWAGDATVAGGSGNRASGSGSTVSGGEANIASGVRSTIGGGADNTGSDTQSTIGGGTHNTASNVYSTIGGGVLNQALEVGTTIGGGQANIADGSHATVGGGASNGALGAYATVPGGNRNVARGQYSFAAGYNARPHHAGSFVWADRSGTQAADSIITTGASQFIIRATGGVGIGTESPQEQLHINAGGPSAIFLGGDGANGPHGIIFDDNSPTAGVQLLWRSSPNQLVIESVSTGTGGNGDDKFVYDRDDNYFAFDARVRPGSDNTHLLGTPTFRWAAIWATNGTINTSDERLKSDVEDIGYGLSAVQELRPVRYVWKDRPEAGSRLGLLAQDVAKIVPEVIEMPETEDGYLGMRYAELVPVLIKAIQEQQHAIEALSERVERLEGGASK